MRVVLDGRYIRDDFPGIGRYVYNLARALPTVAPELDVAVLHQPPGANSRHDLEALRGVGLSLVETDIPVRSLAEQARLPRLARRLGAELFHTPYHVSVCRTPGRRVASLHDLIASHGPELLPERRVRAGFDLATRRALRLADRVVVPSEATRRDLTERYRADPERVVVAQMAPDPGIARASSRAVAELRQRLGLPERYVLSLGTNKPHKNLPRLLDAWALVEAEPACSLVLAGEQDARYPEARRRADELGLANIVFLGAASEGDLAALYTGAELFVLPSLWEGFGLPLVEAMACGVAIVCSSTSSLPEVAGDAALFFDPTSIDSIARAITEALGDPELRSRLCAQGAARARHFRWERTAELTLRAYRG